jgi:hypothetical protein
MRQGARSEIQSERMLSQLDTVVRAVVFDTFALWKRGF